MADPNPRNPKMIEKFYANDGFVHSNMNPGAPLLLMHTIGAKTGSHRVVPVRYGPISEHVFAVFASASGKTRHPDWYYNLKANPDIIVEVGFAEGDRIKTFHGHARLLEGEERDQAWETEKAQWESRRKYDIEAGREIPVFYLECGEPLSAEEREAALA